MTALAAPAQPAPRHIAGGVVAGVVGTLCGLVAAVDARLAVAMAVAFTFLAWASGVRPSRLTRTMLVLVATLLTGYTFFGRGFAYFGVGGIYVGELVLLATFASMVIAGGILVPLRSHVVWLYVAFAAWGTMLAARDVGTYGIDTARDAALWYYGLFMFVGAWLFSTRERIEQAVRWVAVVLPILLLWIPVTYWQTIGYENVFPHLPGATVPIIAGFKGGDMAIFVALVLVFLTSCRSTVAPFTQRWPSWMLWAMCLADFVVIATKNRGGMLAIALSMTIALALMPRLRVMQGLVIGMLALSLLSVANVHIGSTRGRELSIEQLRTNVMSVAGTSSHEHSTAGWRLAFWRDIADDTVSGHYFWTGHGFGLNLADYYGYQANEDGSLRSPHNAAMTVLGRMGVPGLAMWIVLNLAYAAAILRAFLAARRDRDVFWMRVFLLLLVHWAACLTNAMFDPYLEGPQGAIVFWTSMGVGVGAMHAFRLRVREVTTSASSRIAGCES